MKHLEFCAYPPQVAPEVEISEASGQEAPSFIIGSAETGRYLRLGVAEHRVVQLLDGTVAPPDICSEMVRNYGTNLPLATLTRFLNKLDQVGILAGERHGAGQTSLGGTPFYCRWTLFHPDLLFSRLLPALRWIWTPGFFSASLLLILASAALAAANGTELSAYGTQVLREHYMAVVVMAWVVIISHEVAHGMTCKAFGGRVTEIGALLIYYCLPALYCDVSGLYLIPQRRRRLWVIAAGLYWQVLVGSSALLAWFLLAPHTWPADVAMILVLGSVLDVVFNANPLIKLDGYYFLSQWLRIPNLMDRSRAYWRGVILSLLDREPPSELGRLTLRERRIFCLFGLLSLFYNLALPLMILWYAAQYLTDRFRLLGLLMTLLLGLAYVQTPVRRMMAFAFRALRRGKGSAREDNMIHQEATSEISAPVRWRRGLLPAVVVSVVLVMCLPWTASVGSYGVLTVRPDHEAIIRASENGSLVALSVRPGQQVEQGTALGRLGNLDLEEQIVQTRAEWARVEAQSRQLSGELGVQQQEAGAAEVRSNQRRREYKEVDAEEQQIRARLRSGTEAGMMRVAFSSSVTDAVEAATSKPAPTPFPAVLAALEAKVEMRRAKLAEAESQQQRSRGLFAEGILARSDLDAAESKASTLAADLAQVRQQLDAALVDHRRRHGTTETDLNLAESSIATVRAQVAKLGAQLGATRQVATSLEEQLALLERKRHEFALAAPVSGTVFGEELPRMSGRYLLKGTEICRIADTRELLVHVSVPEREIGDVSVGSPVRIKARAFPSRIFFGKVSRVSGEGELDQNRQTIYRVELTIQNQEERLRPGMTAFARIDFGRHSVAWILGHKAKQALRPELWML
ncbi:MAG: efflux RND transporter periplasmic adaptor subunit [Bryobacteraceae bacterium]